MNSQESYLNKPHGHNVYANVHDSNYVDWDTIGIALLKGLEYRSLYYNEILLTELLKAEIKLWKAKNANKDLVINKLATELSKQPAYISSHDWYVTGTITILTAVLTVILTLNLME